MVPRVPAPRLAFAVPLLVPGDFEAGAARDDDAAPDDDDDAGSQDDYEDDAFDHADDVLIKIEGGAGSDDGGAGSEADGATAEPRLHRLNGIQQAQAEWEVKRPTSRDEFRGTFIFILSED